MAKITKPTDLKPLTEGVSVRTNEIDRVSKVVSFDGLYDKFDFYTYFVGDENTPEDEYQKRSIAISKAVKASGGLLASHHQKAKKGYEGYKSFMVKKGFDMSQYNLNKTDPSYQNRIHSWVMDHLISNGINGVESMTGDDGYAHSFTCEERYYRIISANCWKSGDVTQIITVNSKLESDWNVSTSKRSSGKNLPMLFSTGTKTFTNVEAIEKSSIKEDRKRQVLGSERFRLTQDFVVPVYDKSGKPVFEKKTGEQSTISDGEFVPRGLGRKKNRVGAYHVDHKTLAETERTRAGVMSEHLAKMNTIYGSSVKIELKWRDFDTVYKYSDLNDAKDGEYRQIVQALSLRTLRVLNKSSEEISDKIKTGLDKVCGDIKIEYGGEVKADDLVLLFIDPKESYKGKVDPYKEFKASHSDVVSQAVVLGKLNEARSVKPALQCDLAQLLIKAEIFEGKFLIERCETQKEVWFIEPVRIESASDDEDESDDEEEEQDTRDCYEYYRGIVTSEGLKFSKLNEDEVSLLKDILGDDGDLVFGRVKKDGTYTKNRNAVVFYPETEKYMVFTKTGRSAIPDHDLINAWRSKLVSGSSQNVGREWFESYAANPESRDKPKAAVKQMLVDNPDVCAFSKQAFLDAIGTMKGKNREEVPDIIYNDLGIRWLDIAQKEDGKDLIKHQKGFNFSYKNKMYFAGSVGSHDNSRQECFCNLYEIMTNFDELPAGVHEWFLSFSVRNKQTTVKPYFFKHVREFAKIDRFKPEAVIEAPSTIAVTGFDPAEMLANIH